MNFVVEYGCLKECQGSRNVRKIVIPEGVYKMEENIFDDFPKLEKIVLPKGFYAIEGRQFSNCPSLREVIIPESVTSIRRYAFRNCKQLQNLVLPEKLKTIGYGVFQNCESLTKIFIPKSVYSIDSNAFWGCSSLQSIKVDPDNKSFGDVGGVVFDKKKVKLLFYPEGKFYDNYQIPDGVECLGEGAFRKNIILKKVVIPESVTEIQDMCFWNCTNLREIVIPKTVQIIGDNALHGTPFFENCQDKFVILGNGILFKYNGSEENIIIPEGVTEIKPMAFFYCKELKSITIPATVTKIGQNAFNSCTSLKEIRLIHKNSKIFTWDLTKLLYRQNFDRGLMMLIHKKFDDDNYFERVDPKMKYACILDYYLDIIDREATDYLFAKASDFICEFIQDGDLFHLQRISEETDLITSENIDMYIDEAIERTQKGGSLEAQMYLMDYKATHFGFFNPEEFFKL